jgi:hypothetical protein
MEASKRMSWMDQNHELAIGTPARYRDVVELLEFRGNPYIEALPPFYSEKEVKKLLVYYPPYEEKVRELPAHIRLHAVAALSELFHALPIHYDLYNKLALALYRGYVNRNPLAPGENARISQAVEEMLSPTIRENLAHVTSTFSFSFIGVSGMGKTTALRRIENFFEQVIVHSKYQDRPLTRCQVTWLHLECPHNGSLGALAEEFFLEMDRLLHTTYHRDFVQRFRGGANAKVAAMANMAARHGLGFLVIDEIQNLTSARGISSEEMLSALVRMENKFRIPIIMVGTNKALPLFGGEFRRARRAAGQGDLPWDRMQKDAIFEKFVRRLWKYQFTRTPSELTPPLLDTLYDESQGITDLAVKVYLLAQLHAIAEQGDELITPSRLHKVAWDSLKLVRPFLRALRENNEEKIRMLDDIKPIDLALELNKIQATYRIEDDPQDSPEGAESAPPSIPPSEAAQGASISTSEQASSAQTTAAATDANGQVQQTQNVTSQQEAGDLTKKFDQQVQQGMSTHQALQATGFGGSLMEYVKDAEP